MDSEWLIMSFLVITFMLIYNIPIVMLLGVMFLGLYYDDDRVLTIKKAEKIQQINNGFLKFNVVSYIPYFSMYNHFAIAYDRLRPVWWITIIPILCSWVNTKLSNNLLKKATENIKPQLPL
ncbi:hypothetical protein SAMN05446037_1011131 [Anaerovirgula multivorans]|uniref:Uncharacterized protein n=1 Tax=Anaerovirgula multivorans TaxID=312168 RepID=A0A239F2P7_9FIRM|nr:hypothetical protein [Anaerovirgula multivorans]SNS50442.1 hypothetical protein SAMN05446037_1011131 [Anaerovirgula multivorans]